MKNRTGILVAALAATVAAGCELVINIRDYVEVDQNHTTGSGATGATGGAGGSAGEGGDGGTGGATGTACIPFTQTECYSGPAGTAGVGNCKAGKATCNAMGTAFGPCEGEIVPGPEKPDEIGDEACDGYAPGEPIWWRRFGDPLDQWPDAVSADNEGNVYVCGTFQGELQFDDNPVLKSQGGNDVFLVKLDTSGKALWSRRFGDTKEQTGCKMAIDAQGNLIIGGVWQGTLFFGGAVLAADVDADLFVAKFKPDGAHAWSQVFYAGPSTQLGAIGVAADGSVTLAGGYDASLGYYASDAISTTGIDMFLMRVDGATGVPTWLKGFPDAKTAADGDDRIDDIAITKQGEVAAVGTHTGTVSLGGQTLLYGQGQTADFYAMFDQGGDVLWGLGSLGEEPAEFPRVETAPADRLIVGSYFKELAYGYYVRSWPLTGDESTPLFDFLPGECADIEMAVDQTGSVVVALTSLDFANFGPVSHGPKAGGGGLSNVVVMKRSAVGDYSWSHGFGGPQLEAKDVQEHARVAVVPDGGVAVAMSFNAKAIVGSAVLQTAGARDVGVIRIAR